MFQSIYLRDFLPSRFWFRRFLYGEQAGDYIFLFALLYLLPELP